MACKIERAFVAELLAALHGSGFFTAGASTATTGAWGPPPPAGARTRPPVSCGVHDRPLWPPWRHPRSCPFAGEICDVEGADALWVRRSARVAFTQAQVLPQRGHDLRPELRSAEAAGGWLGSN